MLENLVQIEQRLNSVRQRLEVQFPHDIENPVNLANRLRIVLSRLSALEKSIVDNAQVKQQLIEAYGGENNIVLSDLSNTVELFKDETIQEKVSKVSNSFGEFCTLVKSSDNGEQKSRLGSAMLTTRAQLNAALFSSNAATGYDNHRPAGSDNESDECEEETTQELVAIQTMRAQNDSRIEINSGAFLALPESVRGRAKLYQVQRALNIIHSHFEKQGYEKSKQRQKATRKTPVSLKKLDALGAKVTGHTGSNVLQT